MTECKGRRFYKRAGLYLLALCLVALASGGAWAGAAFVVGCWNSGDNQTGTMHRYVRLGEWTWRVLEVSNDGMFLVMSDDLFDGADRQKQFDSSGMWSWGVNTPIVKTISGEMYPKLKAEELAALEEGKLIEVSGLNATGAEIKIGLLGRDEAINARYFAGDANDPNDAGNADRVIGNPAVAYWLRSTSNAMQAEAVKADGGHDSSVLLGDTRGVRPACFLNLESVILKSGSNVLNPADGVGQILNPYMLYATSADVPAASANISVNGNRLTLAFDAADEVVHAYADAPSGTELAKRFALSGVTPTVTALSADAAMGVVVLHLSRALSSDEMPTVTYTHAAEDADGLASISGRTVLRKYEDTLAAGDNVASADFTPVGLHIAGTAGSPITVQTVAVTAVSPAALQSVSFSGDPSWLAVSDDLAETSPAIHFSGTPPTAGSGRFEVGVVTDKGVTSMDATYTISTAGTDPDTDPDVVSTDVTQFVVLVTYNADGTVLVEVRLPFADNFDPDTLDAISAVFDPLTDITFTYVDADDSEETLTPRGAGNAYLRIDATAASVATMSSAELPRISYWLEDDDTEYKQDFDPALKLSAMQITYTNDPPSNNSSGGVGCSAGLGSLGALGLIALIATTALTAARRRRR